MNTIILHRQRAVLCRIRDKQVPSEEWEVLVSIHVFPHKVWREIMLRITFRWTSLNTTGPSVSHWVCVCVHVVVFTLSLNGRCVLHTEILTSVCNNLCTHTRDSPACLCVSNFSVETCCRSIGKFCINTSQWSFKATQTLCWQSIKNVKLFSFYFSNMFKTSTGLHRLTSESKTKVSLTKGQK